VTELAADMSDLSQQLDTLAGFSGFLTSLVEVWPDDRFNTHPPSGGHSLAEQICRLRDVELEEFAVHIRKLLWCDNPVLDSANPGKAHSAQPWRVALYELFQARLGNVAVLRRTETNGFARSGSLGPNTRFSLRDLVHQMHEHDVAAMADLFELSTACGAWPPGIQKPV
jgi:hypothetical protein